MKTTANRRPGVCRAAVKEASPTASTISFSTGSAARNPTSTERHTRGDWYSESEQHIHDNPDWAHQWTAKHLSGKQPDEDFKIFYRSWVDRLYGHPDRERGAALAWQLHDAVKGWLVNRAYRRIYPPLKPAVLTYHRPDCRCEGCEKWRAAVAA